MARLINKLQEIRANKSKFEEGVLLIKNYIEDHNGSFLVCNEYDEKTIEVECNGEYATIFQPYADIDLFYFEA